MPEKKDAVNETDEQRAGMQAPVPPQAARSSFIPVLLSSLALLLAAFALAATLINNKNMNARQPLADIQGKLSAIETRVDHVEASIATSKRDLVQDKLKTMLLHLRGLSHLANKETGLEINKAEAILRRLSSRGTRIKARIDMKNMKPAVKSGKMEAATTPPENAEGSTAQKNPQFGHHTITAPAEAGGKAGSQDKTATTAGKEAHKTVPQAVRTGEKSAPETAAGTPHQPSHKKPEAPQIKIPANTSPGAAGNT